ncbi:hypothetical protein VRK_22980 [Vibrio sp. MEBiC08052]|nr:hypothetical protein VRK_22980 [Vibrio sp. MEBiC08052]
MNCWGKLMIISGRFHHDILSDPDKQYRSCRKSAISAYIKEN